MVYASSKDALRRALVGIAAEIQGTSSDEVEYETGEQNALAFVLPLVPDTAERSFSA